MGLFLEKREREQLEKLGYDVDGNGRIVKMSNRNRIKKSASTDELIYCGFNTFLSKDGLLFEKVGNELVEVDSEELDAERRFVDRHTEKIDE